MSYNSKYTGAQVEEFLDQIENKQNEIEDLEAIRSGAALGRTAIQSSDLAKVATSGSYNDLTDKPSLNGVTIEGAKTSRQYGLANASDIVNLQEQIDGKQPVGDYATQADLSQGLATKQDVIADLAQIRSNAELGATALQPATAAATYVPLTQKATANGVATLDANTLIPTAQLPTIDGGNANA